MCCGKFEFWNFSPAVLATTSVCQFIQDHVSGKLGWEAFAGGLEEKGNSFLGELTVYIKFADQEKV